MAEHAKLSASSAKKWLNCPGCVSLEGEIQEKESAYASEGTTAHTLGEAKILLALKRITKAKYNKVIKELEITQDMEDYTDSYRDYVLERYNYYKGIDPEAELEVELKVSFDLWVPEGFGTADIVILAGNELEIIDLKYGQGVKVSAQDNPQLKLYALGVYDTFNFIYDTEHITTTIFQPRLDNIDSDRFIVANLLAWGELTKSKAADAYNEVQEFNAGTHCAEGFCKARPICRAYSEYNLELAKMDFALPSKLTNEEISEVLEKGESVAKWVNIVKTYALEQMIDGVEIPGYKVVEGRSNRKWNVDETIVAGQLIAKGVSEDDVYPRKLNSLGSIEKYLGKKDFQEYIGELVVKPQGAPTIAPITDKRHAIKSVEKIAEEFDN